MQNSTTIPAPQHVAIIMDGNGRWAKAQGKERVFGHINGVESVRRAMKAAVDHGVKHLTIYAFSTENWSRPQQEVDALMELLCKSIVEQVPEFLKEGIRVRFIGDTSKLNTQIKEAIKDCESKTASASTIELIIAINYSSRDEIIRATRKIAEKILSKEISVEDIDQNTIDQNLDTAGIPDPDLIIRTSGEQRLSNFMLWQAAYSELYFTDILWPDFNEQSFSQAIEEFKKRDRRFGAIKPVK